MTVAGIRQTYRRNRTAKGELMKLFDPHFLEKSLETSLEILRLQVESDLKKKDN